MADNLDEGYLRTKDLDALAGDPSAVAAVNWDRIDHIPKEDGSISKLGYDKTTGQSFAMGDDPVPSGVRRYVQEEDGTKFLVEVRQDGSEWLLGRVGEPSGVSMLLKGPDAPTSPEEAAPPSMDKGGALKSINTILNAPVAGLTRGVVKAGLSVGDMLGVIPGETAAKISGLLDDEASAATKGNPVAGALDEGGAIAGQYLLPGGAAMKGARAAGASRPLAATLAGLTTDFAFTGQDDDSLGELIRDIGPIDQPTVELVRSSIADALAKGEDDGEFEKRLKNVGAGLLAPATVAAISGAYRAARATEPMARRAFDTFARAVDEAHARVAKNEAAGIVMMHSGGPSTDQTLAGLKPAVDALRSGRTLPGEADILGKDWSAYKTGPVSGTDFNMDRISTEDGVKETINVVSQAYQDSVAERTQGVIPHELTRQVADLIGANEETALKAIKTLPADTQDLHVRALVMRDMLVKSGEALETMARKVAAPGPRLSDVDYLAFREQLAAHAALQTQMKGVQTDIARALSAFRIAAQAPVAQQGAMISELLDSLGGVSTAREIAERLLQTPIDKRADIIRKAATARVKDVFFELWINGMLSGPKTHGVNFASNALFAAWQIPERLVAGGIGAVRHAIPGTDPDRVRLREGMAMLHGFIQGHIDGWRIAFGREVNPLPPGLSKVESQNYSAITAQNFNLDPASWGGRVADWAGRVVRSPGTALSKADDVWKATSYRMELAAQAYRASADALDRGATKADAAELYASVMRGEKEAATKIAIDAATTATFTKQLDGFSRSIQGLQRYTLGRVILPFVRTPTNIFLEFGKRSPLALAMPNGFWKEVIAGGARRDLALAKVSTGSALMAWAASLAMEDNLTGGGPKDPALRQVWLETHQPYSVRIGDQWVPIGRLEPLSTLFGVAADSVEVFKYAPDDSESDVLAAAAVAAVMDNLGSKTYTQGIATVAQAFADPERYGPGLVQSLSGSLVPSVINTIEQAVDPTIRVRRTDPNDSQAKRTFDMILNAIRARTPGLSDSLPPARNFWGEEVTAYEGGGWNVINPFAPRGAKASPVDEEILRLKLPLSMPDRKVKGVKTSPEQYDLLVRAMNGVKVKYQDDAGQEVNRTMREAMEWLVSSPTYRAARDSMKVKMLKSVRDRHLDAASAQITTPGSHWFDAGLFSAVLSQEVSDAVR